MLFEWFWRPAETILHKFIVIYRIRTPRFTMKDMKFGIREYRFYHRGHGGKPESAYYLHELHGEESLPFFVFFVLLSVIFLFF